MRDCGEGSLRETEICKSGKRGKRGRRGLEKGSQVRREVGYKKNRKGEDGMRKREIRIKKGRATREVTESGDGKDLTSSMICSTRELISLRLV